MTRADIAAALAGPVHGRIRCLRGMCTDERPHVEIDLKLGELESVVYELRSGVDRERENGKAATEDQRDQR